MKSQYHTRTQSGLATLTVTLILLIAATSFTFYSMKSKVSQTKIASNDVRYTEALVNAESGLDYALSLLNSKDWQTATAGISSADLGAGKMEYTVTQQSAKYGLKITEACAGCDTFIVASTGESSLDDNQKTVSRIVKVASAGGKIKAPILAAGSYEIYGSSNVHPGTADSAIQAGGSTQGLVGSSQTNGKPVDTDIGALRGDNFLTYMGVTQDNWADYKAQPEVQKINGCGSLATAIAAAEAPKTIWVTGDCNVSGIGTIGASGKTNNITNGVTLIIHNGNLSGTFNMYGLIYAFNSNNDVTSASFPYEDRTLARFGADVTGDVFGALILDYKYVARYNGSLTVHYNDDALENRRTLFPNDAYWVPGGWSDF
ncbi:pilus assembly PilX family protein [Motilimonas pumila]|uniref:Type 4 fimbrial biogenesis protein PilX N-terminal domain-containing protein n=1 Tax=Motilimonas pumila TaxID=2303987 RepID=A0A418YF32_9GAMM|nr:pilus assembly PilX N-terminal domain-containing protein [Motilimonas pumila]RJG47861.1 hypothetical protein D1Z90_09105 [Motilimonas pumila]